jgi:hypothetical protein
MLFAHILRANSLARETVEESASIPAGAPTG